MTGWRDRAACRTEDPDLFFPSTAQEAERARRICAACAVRAECLDDAIARGERFGIRAGLTPAGRRPARLPRGSLADTSGYLPVLGDLVAVLQLIAAATLPPDPMAAEHRRVLLAALEGRDPDGEDRMTVLRRARNEARHHRAAGVPVPGPVGELEREFWRTVKQAKQSRAA